jgi:hypothetical protein
LQSPLQSISLPLPGLFNKLGKKARRKLRDPKWQEAARTAVMVLGFNSVHTFLSLNKTYHEPVLVGACFSAGQLLVAWNQLANTNSAIHSLWGYEPHDDTPTPSLSYRRSLYNLGHATALSTVADFMQTGFSPTVVIGGTVSLACYAMGSRGLR